jgi:acetyl esterase/lipase
MERPFAKRLAARGSVAVPVTYRLGPDGRFPGAVTDLKEAIRWLRAHAVEYGIDGKIGAVGGSAGGHLAAFLAATNGLKAFEGEVGNLQQPSTVQAVVDIDGTANFSEPALIAQEEQSRGATSRFLGGTHAERAAVRDAASPLAHVGRDTAPVLFINSTAKRPILPGREEMSARLKALGIDSAVVVMPDTPHPFWLVQPWFDRSLDEAERFLRRHLQRSSEH